MITGAKRLTTPEDLDCPSLRGRGLDGRFEGPFPLTYKYVKHNPASASTMENEKICSSCGIRLIGKSTTFFPCPNCGKTEIGRCPNCRDQSVTYICAKCGFSGP
jgi:predicted RNA-binding Zn-ribbon protein involved in translation (DUF1610 family)